MNIMQISLNFFLIFVKLPQFLIELRKELVWEKITYILRIRIDKI